MPVKPDVMDGVPDEPGYYLVNLREEPVYGPTVGEYSYVLVRNNDGLEAIEPERYLLLIREEKFDNHKWSERIVPPESKQ
jgi:hypothetical protein